MKLWAGSHLSRHISGKFPSHPRQLSSTLIQPPRGQSGFSVMQVCSKTQRHSQALLLLVRASWCAIFSFRLSGWFLEGKWKRKSRTDPHWGLIFFVKRSVEASGMEITERKFNDFKQTLRGNRQRRRKGLYRRQRLCIFHFVCERYCYALGGWEQTREEDGKNIARNSCKWKKTKKG